MPTLASMLHKARKTVSSTYKKRTEEDKKRLEAEAESLRVQREKDKKELYDLMERISVGMNIEKAKRIYVPSGPVSRARGGKRIIMTRKVSRKSRN